MPSEDMLKKLLDEFVEKETLLNEELNAVADQIQQLEARLGLCHQRLSTISGDKEKIERMRDRYGNGSNGGHSASTTDYQYGLPAQPAPAPQTAAAAPPPAAPAPPAPPASQSPPTPPLPTKVTGSPPAPPLPAQQPAPAITALQSALLKNQSAQAPAPANLPPAPKPAMPISEQTLSLDLTSQSSEQVAATAGQATEAQPAQSEPTEAKPAEPAKGGAASVVDLGTDEAAPEDDTVKSINDALRSLFR
jgi:hypothetical protein